MTQHLRQDPNVQRVLISSPCAFVGEYGAPSLRIDHAWPGSVLQASNRWGTETPFTRSFFVVSFETEPLEPAADPHPRILPDYSHVGERVCVCLAVLFGKRFDNHGFLQRNGSHQVPAIDGLQPIHYRSLPFNSNEARPDLPLELNLEHFELLAGLFSPDSPQDLCDLFFTAGRLYLRALRSFDVDLEFAFLDLVSAIEVLSSAFEFTEEELCDERLQSDLQAIIDGLDNGSALAQRFRDRLFQVRRRFALTIMALLDESFFAVTESKEEHCALVADDIWQRVLAAYDVRSRHVHTGQRFGQYIMPMKMLNEVPIGKYEIQDYELARNLARSPTLSGFERIVRYCLLRFVHVKAFAVHDGLGESA